MSGWDVFIYASQIHLFMKLVSGAQKHKLRRREESS